MQLRPYQQEAVDLSIAELRRTLDPFMIEAATGAGKSLLVSAIAKYIHEMTGKRVLCTAPTSELVTQNREKYIAMGGQASIFSSSAGEKSLRHPVVFGTPGTVKNAISKFKKDFALVIPDECDLMTPTMRAIIDEMRDGNPNLRVMGMTATPYRLQTGFIFREWPDGRVNGEDVCRDPYFIKCIYRITARKLIEDGYLTTAVVGEINAEGYDTSALRLNKMGQFDAADVERAFIGHGRKTAAIVGDIVERSRERKGVLIFAATVRHAEEVMASLPPHMSEIITGETKNRTAILKRFKNRELKYLVNVSVLTVGVDMPHVDHIAVLRATESARLYQQIIGRGLRLSEGKADCLISDYTDNLDRHFPDGDIFNPEIKAGAIGGAGEGISVSCPECGYVNEAKVNPDYTDYQYDQHGYALDVFGEPMRTEYGPVPVHYTRRCWGVVGPEYTRCGYYWTSKECESCGEKNDISARYCAGCRGELVDPNARLISEFRQLKRDPTKPQTDEVVGFEAKSSISARGNQTIRVDIVTPYRSFSVWIMAVPKNARQQRDLALYNDATRNGIKPATVTYCKDADSGFYRILGYNAPADEAPEGYEKGKRK